jgi:sigma-B regulation protein RsbU (phosphoserine phosphatase)
MYKLTGIVGESLQTWEIPEGISRIGRSSDLELSIPDRSVSRTHAALHCQGETLMLEDLGSRNGTSVNGVRLTAPQKLNADDRVSFGNVTLKLTTEDLQIQPSLVDHESLDSTFKLNWKDVRQLESSSREQVRMFPVLTDLGEFLVHHQPSEEIYERCLDTVEKVLTFQRACLLLLDDEGKPQMRAARFKGESGNMELALSQTMVQTVINERASLLVRDAQSDTRFQLQESVILGKIRSALIAPLFDNTQVIGVLYVDTSELSAAYNKEHLQQLALVANILAVKITNSRLLTMQREKERIQQEIDTAARIQRTLLLSKPPCPEHYELCVRLEPCSEVGGDLYDVLVLPNGRFLFVLGDVVGHGVGAAMLMANALAGVRALAELCHEPVDLVQRLHDQMCRSTDTTNYVTMFLGILDPNENRMSYVNAGHEAPLILQEGEDPILLESTGPPVGLLAGMTFEAGEVELHPGAMLCAWSDGIPEAHQPRDDDGDPEFFSDRESMESLLRSLQGSPVSEMADVIFDRVDDFLEDVGAPDDRTLLILRRNSE